MNSPKISVIVPVYNAEQYISHCIECVLAQTFRDFELLLIDDGSTDNSGKICDEYEKKDSRIKVIHKINAGVSAARNDGINIALGTLVSFVDSDDWVEKDYLQTIIDNLCDNDILFWGSVWHLEDGCSCSISFGNLTFLDNVEQGLLFLLKNDIRINYLGFTWNKVFKKDIIDRYNIRFVENLSVSEDEVFTIDYCKHIKSMRVIENHIYHYLWKKQGLTHKKKNRSDYLLLISSLYNSMSNTFVNQDLRLLYLNRIVCLYNNVAWQSRNPFRIIIDEWEMVRFCKKNKVNIPIKSIGRKFINKLK